MYDQHGRMNIDLQDYNNRTDTRKKYAKHLIRNGKGIQAAEINEIQDTAHLRTKSLGDALWNDGQIIAGMTMGIDAETAEGSCSDGTIYINGEVHPVAAKKFKIPREADVVAGIWYSETVVTEIQDGDLRDPAVGSPNFQQPGAARIRISVSWGLSNDEHSENDDFYPLYTISGLQIVSQPNLETPEDNYLSKAVDVVRRYDRESNGSYIVDGLVVTSVAPDTLEDGECKHVYNISAGKAHVLGFEVNRPFALRLVVDERPAVLEVEDEYHRYSESGGEQTIYFKHVPVTNVRRVSVEKEKTTNVQHGISGSMDRLQTDSVTEIVEVKDTQKTYKSNADYRLTNDCVNWAPSGDEPSPGATYEVTYRYRDVIELDPEDWDAEKLTVSGLVQGSDISLQYDYRLPRYDLICVDADGAVSVVYGVSHRHSPVPPAVPSGLLRLATVKHTWEGLPCVSNDGVRVTTMAAQASIYSSLLDLYDLVSQERLKTDAVASAPTASRGVFVDPFIDDDMRDAGIKQTASVVDGVLMLPIAADITDIMAEGNTTLDFTEEVIFSQEARTGSMKINPYQAASAPPANVSVSPSVDRWEDIKTNWTSAVTKTITTSRTKSEAAAAGVRWGGITYINRGTSTSNEVVASSRASAAYMRIRTLTVSASGFNANESVTVTFAGRKVTTQNADSSGVLRNCQFEIPSNVPCGTVQILLTGSKGVTGSCSYTATGTVLTETRRVVTTLTRDYFDPLAQTFVLDNARYITAVDIWFTKRGSSEVRVQIRDVQNGMPGRAVLAEGKISREEIKSGQSNRIKLARPFLLDANVEYALVVLTNTSDHELAIAELGQRNLNNNTWLTSQAYETGVLLSSSNASTWTPHQTMDLWFRLVGAKFTSSKKTIELGEMELSNTTDLMPLAEVDYPESGAEVTFVISDERGKEVARVQAGQSLECETIMSGTYKLAAEMIGSATLSPVLYSFAQFVAGRQSTDGTYITRAFTCGTGKKVRVTLNCFTPGTSGIKVYVQTEAEANNSGSWTLATKPQAVTDTELGDGWQERTFEVACSMQTTRIKIELSGDAMYRPYAASLRAVILDA